jgi:hypothetical protein
MNNYLVKFNGRLVNSQGICEEYSVNILAENEADAEQQLYRTHEHIMRLKIVLQLYKVVRVMEKTGNKKLIEKDLTLKEAQRYVMRFKTTPSKRYCFYKQNY